MTLSPSTAVLPVLSKSPSPFYHKFSQLSLFLLYFSFLLRSLLISLQTVRVGAPGLLNTPPSAPFPRIPPCPPSPPTPPHTTYPHRAGGTVEGLIVVGTAVGRTQGGTQGGTARGQCRPSPLLKAKDRAPWLRTTSATSTTGRFRSFPSTYEEHSPHSLRSPRNALGHAFC